MDTDNKPKSGRDPWYDIFTAPDPEVTADCAYHPGRVAMGTCTMCGAAICIECRHTVVHEPYCPKCAELNPLRTAAPVPEAEAPPEPQKEPDAPAQAPVPEGDGFVLRFSGSHRKAA